MPRKKVKRQNKNTVTSEFKTQVDWQKHKLRPGSKRYNTMIKNRFGISKNHYYETLTDEEKSTLRDSELASANAAKSYTEFEERQTAYSRALKKLYQDQEFLSASHSERIDMMINIEPKLAESLTADSKSFDLKMTLLAYEDRERLINTGEYAVIRGKQYRDNYLSAISVSEMPVPKNIKEALKDIPDEDIVYFIDELLPPLPDWYGLNGSTLMPAIDFIKKLQSAVDFYNKQKGQQSK